MRLRRASERPGEEPPVAPRQRESIPMTADYNQGKLGNIADSEALGLPKLLSKSSHLRGK